MQPVVSVRAIIPDGSGRVLLLRRANTSHEAGSWCLPGGKVDYDETVEAALRKEIAEETALTCDSCRFLFYQDCLPYESGGMHCINLYFECAVSGDLKLNDESGDWAWVLPSRMTDYEITFGNDVALRDYWSSK